MTQAHFLQSGTACKIGLALTFLVLDSTALQDYYLAQSHKVTIRTDICILHCLSGKIWLCAGNTNTCQQYFSFWLESTSLSQKFLNIQKLHKIKTKWYLTPCVRCVGLEFCLTACVFSCMHELCETTDVYTETRVLIHTCNILFCHWASDVQVSKESISH